MLTFDHFLKCLDALVFGFGLGDRESTCCARDYRLRAGYQMRAHFFLARHIDAVLVWAFDPTLWTFELFVLQCADCVSNVSAIVMACDGSETEYESPSRVVHNKIVVPIPSVRFAAHGTASFPSAINTTDHHTAPLVTWLAERVSTVQDDLIARHLVANCAS